jgi:hypothetical protein
MKEIEDTGLEIKEKDLDRRIDEIFEYGKLDKGIYRLVEPEKSRVYLGTPSECLFSRAVIGTFIKKYGAMTVITGELGDSLPKEITFQLRKEQEKIELLDVIRELAFLEGRKILEYKIHPGSPHPEFYPGLLRKRANYHSFFLYGFNDYIRHNLLKDYIDQDLEKFCK